MTGIYILTEQQPKDIITIAPNPNNGNFEISISEMNIQRITVFNVLGEIVLEKENISSREFNVDISQQPEGVYYVSIESENSPTQTKKMIKQ